MGISDWSRSETYLVIVLVPLGFLSRLIGDGNPMRRHFGDHNHSSRHTYPLPNLYRPLPNATQLPRLITASNPVGANRLGGRLRPPDHPAGSRRDRHRNLYGNRDNLPTLKASFGPRQTDGALTYSRTILTSLLLGAPARDGSGHWPLGNR